MPSFLPVAVKMKENYVCEMLITGPGTKLEPIRKKSHYYRRRRTFIS